MLENKFMKCIKFVLEAEGDKYVNDPNDPGGETKFGISKRAFPNVDIKKLTVDIACRLYFDNYWLPSGANSQPWPMDVCLLDSSVLDGVSAAKNMMSQSEGDYKKFLELRWVRYTYLGQKKYKLRKFVTGWHNRINNLKKFIDAENVDLPAQS